MASSKRRRGAALEEPETNEPVYSFLRQVILEKMKSALKTGSKVTLAEVQSMTELEDAEDTEMLIPVDLREMLNQNVAAKNDARAQVEAYVRAEKLFAENSEGNSAQGRPVAMTAQAWREQALESDDGDFDDEEDSELGMEGREEGAEESDLECDEAIEFDDEEEQPTKKRKVTK
eukprot:TRINITY_DN21408_c0_g1_i1.p1 TRINITY_DN21408_c0_g1~~TRINITY_DN21408_c0_g1_i1.p1  ORF type:complete len:175 (-),score=53.34 TRINITY_DN21408_c0_g1_i1:201-725(-)